MIHRLETTGVPLSRPYLPHRDSIYTSTFPSDGGPSFAPGFSRQAGRLAAGLIFLSTFLTVLYQWWTPAHDLTPDEAHYWDWSRHLDWSYYSKGPLVAWLIRVADVLLGDWSVAWTGDRAAAIRFPAALCHAAVLAGCYLLTCRVFQFPRLALWVVFVSLMVPLVRIGALLITIDPPFLACWCWALLMVLQALDGRRLAWWGAAVFIALGILAKYTMLLFPAAITLFVLCHRRRPDAFRGLIILYLGVVVGSLPILYWNAQHDWVTFRHVLGQVAAVGQQQTSRGQPFGLLLFLGGQLGTLFGFWLLAFLAAAWFFRPSRCRDYPLQLLWWTSVPLWLFFAAASLIKPGQPNWPAPTYIAGFILAVAWFYHQLTRGPYPRLLASLAAVNLALGLAAVLMLHFPQTYRPVLARWLPPPSPHQPTPIRKLDPTARLAGWKSLAAYLDQLREQIAQRHGQAPILCGTYWNQPGILRFYCQGHPDTYTIGIPNRSDRHSQYDFWRPNPVSDPELFHGRTFLIVGDIGPHLLPAFEKVEPPLRFTHSEEGIPLQSWTIWIAHGFRGWKHLPSFQVPY